MDAHHEINRRNTVVKRAIVVAISVILALVVAMPMVSGKPTTTKQKPSPPGQLKKNLPDLTAEWWKWAASTNPSPLVGGEPDYTDAQCNGEYVEGVFFLAGSLATEPETRTCTVPAHTPILFSPFNYLCSELFPEDQPPYDTCANKNAQAVIDSSSGFYARVDGKDANQQRIASGLFQWTIPVDKPFLGFLPAGTYESAQDGLWVYLENGLNKGQHTVQFGGTFTDTPLGSFEGTKVNYNLKAK
jgi:hypothetical protein